MSALEFLFVYGTLKRGGKYHNSYLKDAKFHVIAKTVDKFDMFSNGEYPFIFVNGSTQIHGEIFQVDHEQLTNIDKLEDVPNEYIRAKITLTCNDKEIEAWTYISQAHMKKDRLQYIENGNFPI